VVPRCRYDGAWLLSPPALPPGAYLSAGAGPKRLFGFLLLPLLPGLVSSASSGAVAWGAIPHLQNKSLVRERNYPNARPGDLGTLSRSDRCAGARPHFVTETRRHRPQRNGNVTMYIFPWIDLKTAIMQLNIHRVIIHIYIYIYKHINISGF